MRNHTFINLFYLISLLLLSNILSSNKNFLKSNSNTTNTTNSNPLTQNVTESSAFQAYCFINNNGIVYDLNPLYNSLSDYKTQAKDGGMLNFNICKNASITCKNKTGLVVYSSNNDCQIIAGSDSSASNMNVIGK